MQRRELIALVGGTAVAWPLGAHAQQKAMPVVGFLSGSSPETNAAIVAGFHLGLSKTGFVDRENVVIEHSLMEGHLNRLDALATNLVNRKVELIISTGGLAGARAAKSVTSTIPIVFVISVDPVATGLVASLAQPGGNLTGITVFGVALSPKRLELLSELVPQARVIALIWNTTNPAFPSSAEGLSKETQQMARAKGIQLRLLKVSTEKEIDRAFGSLAQSQVGALIVATDPFFYSRQDQLIALASRHAIPAIYDYWRYVAAGGLISYGPSYFAIGQEAGIYAGRILKGEKPAELPIQQPTEFELVINLKTAKALGLTIPPAVLARADEVIE